MTEMEKKNAEDIKKAAELYDAQKKEQERLNAEDVVIEEGSRRQPGATIEEVNDENVPDLEEVNEEQRKMEELEKTKEEKKKEKINNTLNFTCEQIVNFLFKQCYN